MTGKAGITRLVIMMGLKIATSPFSPRVSTAANGLFNGLIWPKDGCASNAYATTAGLDFLPLPAAPPFLAGQETPP